MAQLVSLLLACQVGLCLAVAAHSALVERGGSRILAAGLTFWSGVALTGAVTALGAAWAC